MENVGFENILSRIKAGEDVNQKEILPFLLVNEKEVRLQINYKLAKAYSQIKDFSRAKVFIERA